MANKWTERPLSDVADVIDSRHKTPEYTELGMPMVRVVDVKGGLLDLSDTKKISSEDYADYSKGRDPEPGDLVFSRVGSYGNVSYVDYSVGRFCLGQNTALIVPKIDWRYLYYQLTSPPIKRQIEHSAVGAVQKTISLKSIRALQVPVPPLPEQKAIAVVLGALDDKIELNRRMNATLEAMARALFQSWFVDFAPVRAKAEGRPPAGLDEPTAALFPAQFQPSELGEIPQGWSVASICEAASVIYGAPFASKQFNDNGNGKPLIRIRDLAKESPGVWTPEVHPKGYVVRPGDIVVGMDGEFRAYLWGGEEAWLNQRVCVFAPKPGYSAAFVRNSILAPLAHVEATETATTVIHLGKSDIDRFKTVIPTPEVATAFTKLCQPWYDRIVTNKQQSRTLATLRDTLLPKLLSGELSVATTNEKAAA